MIEIELLRKRLYNNLIHCLSKKLPKLHTKDIYNLLLRYIFNKKVNATKDDDPVFIITECKAAGEQLMRDLEYFKLNSKSSNTAEGIVTFIESKIKDAAKVIKNSKVQPDGRVALKDGYLEYNCDVELKESDDIYRLKDISNLGALYPDHLSNALALNLRYNYIRLGTHGLARLFDKMERLNEGETNKGEGGTNEGENKSTKDEGGTKSKFYLPSDDVTEGFGSAFNHYFNSFCSAFPDLESVYGSRGSFFDQTEFYTSIIYVNPVFDQSIIILSIEKVFGYLEQLKQTKLDDAAADSGTSETMSRTFVFTLPDWTDFPELDLLVNSKWTTKVNRYKKGELPFVDHMNNKKVIYPCAILEVILKV